MNTFRLLLITLLLTAIPIRGFSYTDDQVVEFGECYYKVVSGTKLTLSFIGTKASKTGPLNLPAKVTDKNGYILTVIGAEYNPQYRSGGITSVQLPETMEFLNSYVFSGASLTTMNIPKKLQKIDPGAWNSIDRAPKFTVDIQNQYFENDANGALYTKGKKALLSVPSYVTLQGGKYTVNQDVKTISASAFKNVQGLKRIVLPKNLEKVFEGYPTIAPSSSLEAFEIPQGAPNFKVIDGVLFRDTTLVVYPIAKPDKNYTVPNEIKAFTYYAMSNNRLLESINLNRVSRLVKSSIYNPSKLTSITLPQKLKPYNKDTGDGMVEGCFEACSFVTEYRVQSGNKDFVSANGVVFSKDMKTLYFYPASKLGTTYNIPQTVEVIAGHAFQSARNLTSMHFPAKVTRINAEAFRDVENLKTITFDANSNLQEIEYHAFRWCHSLKEVSLPKSLQRLNEIFYMCINLETINIAAGSKLTSIREKAFSTNPKLKAFNFLGDCDLVRIEKNVFAGLRELQSFTIPKSVRFIESNAFIGCASMKTVKFHRDAEIAEIGAGAFADCGITSINIPAKVVKIEREAFLKCEALHTINITKTTTSISPEAFKYCSNLTAINVDKDNDVYSSIDGYLLSKSKKTLMIFPPGKANDKFTLLPPSITTIGDYAFENAPNQVQEVVVKKNVKYIGAKAFVKKNNTLKSVFFIESEPTKGMLSTTRFKLDETEENFNEFDHDTKIYVKKSAYDKYKTEWNKMVYNTTKKQEEESPFNFTNQIEYKIKDAQISNRYTTFAREFDVDFSDCALSGGMNVAAFVSGQIKTGSGDHGETTTHHVRMKSIDLNGGVSDSYGYIPANTGVLLKVFNKTGDTSGKLYYTIGEKDNVPYNISNNIMKGVMVKSKPVNASVSSPIYVLQGGIFRKATTTISNFPVHKAYMLLPSGAPAKLSLSFGDDDETTDIESVTTDEEAKDNDVYYNLNGQRVSNPQKGVYIHNGKKVIIK